MINGHSFSWRGGAVGNRRREKTEFTMTLLHFCISASGKLLAFVRRNNIPAPAYLLVLYNIDGSGEHELHTRQAPLTYGNALAWSPDDSKLLVSAGSQQGDAILISNLP